MYPDSKPYYDWVRNWLYSEVNNPENSLCEPPYEDFSNDYCFNIKAFYKSNDVLPMIFKCYVGITPFYCPFELTLENDRQVNTFGGYGVGEDNNFKNDQATVSAESNACG